MITINQRNYALTDLPPEVFSRLKRIREAQSEITRLEAQLEAFRQIEIDAYLSVLKLLDDSLDNDV